MISFIEILDGVELFKGITNKNIEEVITKEFYYIKNYRKGAVIYFQKEKCITLDIVLQGAISIEGIDNTGNYVTISDFTTGNTIGENLIFSNENFYPMTIMSKENSTILHLKKELILKLCQSDTNFLVNFLQSLSDKTLILANRIKTLSFKSLRKSIVDYLICESYCQGNNKIRLTVTKKNLAEKFGVQRTSLSRELNKMREEGLIEYDARYITILNKELLILFKE